MKKRAKAGWYTTQKNKNTKNNAQKPVLSPATETVYSIPMFVGNDNHSSERNIKTVQ